ncbi:peptide deformylase [Yunchengibacter salinarum]|uniref:peptide deformylase n=1 Tax=Yunchengibacter salinarum TaxID=3133399 RepID=UPI0035B698C4
MAKLDLITVPDPLLKTRSEPVGQVDDDLRRLMDNMLETMYAAPGIGLAAIQVAVPKRLLVVDTEGDPTDPRPRFMVNPEVIWESGERSSYNEGCLSVPDHYAEVERPAQVTVRYLGYDGKLVEETLDGLEATCVQHEIDHLNGVVFIDYLSRLKRNMIIKKVAKLTRDVAVL